MRETIHQFLQWASAKATLEKLRGWTGGNLIMPFYHTMKGKEPLPHISRLYTPRTVATFKKDLKFFQKHYKPISLEELMTCVKNDTEPTQPSYFLSFDDGLREVYDLVMPILVKKKIPATIFLNSDFVDNKALFYRYKLSLLQEKLNTQKITKAQSQAAGELLSLNAPENALIEESLINVTHSNQQLLDKVAEILEVDFNKFLKKQKPYLTSIQIRKMIKAGFTFGAHSCDHPKYEDMNLVGQLQQTKQSMKFVKDTFKLKYKAFAFPFTDYGVGSAFFEKVAKGKIADITFGCAGLKELEDDFPWHFQRIPMERFETSAEEQIKGEYAYFILKGLLGMNGIVRE
ncbi:MAG: polysaccharide deacetylase family protein [Saprospiraceae bacterium]